MEELTGTSPLDGISPMRPSVAGAVREMRDRAPLRSAKGIFKHPPECTAEEENFIADCLKRNIPLYVIAGMIHCEKRFLSRYIRKRPELLELREEQTENILDEAEYQLDRLNRAGNASTIIFTLQTKGRKRGWTTEDLSGDGSDGGGGRIVMGLIPPEEVARADAAVSEARAETPPLPPSNPGGALTDPVSLAAAEEAAKGLRAEMREEARAAVAEALPKPIDAEYVEVGGPAYSDGGAGVPAESGDEDPWASGADSPFFQ